MGAIAGIWDLDGRPVDPAVLAAIGERLAHRAPDGIELHVEGAVGLVAGLSRITPESAEEVQPFVHSSGASIVFEGRLDERVGLVDRLGMDPASSDAEVVLEAVLRFGDEGAALLTGDYAWAIFEPAYQRLTLARDAVGARPLFWFRSRRLVVFASEIKALLAHPDVPAEPDEEELATFVLQGTITGTRRTLFRGIERVMPSFVVRIDGDGSAQQRMVWDFDPKATIRLGSFEAYAEGFREVFERAVRRRLRSKRPVAFSLSGGLDSTSIFGLAQRAHTTDPSVPELVPITFSSMDGTIADESRYVDDIAAAYGVEILSVPPSAIKPTASVRDVVRTAEIPGTETFWDCMREVHRAAAEQGARTLISGHLGDQLLFDRAYLVDLFDRLHWATIAHHIREYPRWNLEGDTSPLQWEIARRLVRDHLPLAMLPLARRMQNARRTPLWDRPWFTPRFRSLGSRSVSSRPLVRWQFASAHAHSIYWQVRGPSGILAMEACDRSWAANGLELAFPYADRDVISYLMAIPGEMQSYDGVPRAILREAMRGVIPESVRGRRWKASFGPMIDAAVDADRDDLLAAARRFREVTRLGFVDPERLNMAISHLTDDPSDGATAAGLNNTLALEAWAAVFLDEQAAMT